MGYKVQKKMTEESENWIDIIDYDLTLKKAKKFIRPFFDEEQANRFIEKNFDEDTHNLFRVVPIEDDDNVAKKTSKTE